MISSRNAFLAMLAGLGITSSVFAGASNKNPNPFGNGSYFSQNGTFSAVLRSPEQPNFLGVVQVSTTTTNYGSANTNVTNPVSTGWATVFTPAIPNYPAITLSATGFTTNFTWITNYVVTNISTFTYTKVTTTNYFTNIITNQIPNPTNTNSFSFITNTNYSSNVTVRTITNTNTVPQTNVQITNIASSVVAGGTTTNYLNVPGIQWSGIAFGVLQNNNQIAVTYSLGSTISSIYSVSGNFQPLTATNVNGGGQFTATLNNSYPNQTLSGTGFCTVQPSIGPNTTNNAFTNYTYPVFNFTNTVSGFRVTQ